MHQGGPEFGPMAGQLLIIYKALYGLCSSGKGFGELLAACLKELGFTPSKVEPQIFIRKSSTRDVYELVGVYVDDLAIIMDNPEEFLTQLQSGPYNFKLKGSGPMNFHMGCGSGQNEHDVLSMDPTKYLNKMVETYKQLYGQSPKLSQTPLI